MSAPESRDPLVVNTQDGSCWTRRAVSRSGRGLYALAAVQGEVPDMVLATLAELAEHGLSSMSMHALPVPVGSEPQALSAERLDEILSCQPDGWLEAPWMFAHVETDGDEPAYIRVFEVASGTTVATLPDWAGNLAMWIADAREAMPELLSEVGRLRARVAELEAERHTTNEALDDAVQELRARRPEDPCRPCGCPKRFGRHAWGCPTLAAEADGITRQITPTQALRVNHSAWEDPHDSPLHHTYLMGRDLPAPGGA